MSYCMTLCLPEYQKYIKSSSIFVQEIQMFHFWPVIFWYLLWHRIIQYLIGKLLVEVKSNKKSYVVEQLLTSVRASYMLPMYHTNRALSNLHFYAVYIPHVTINFSIYISLWSGILGVGGSQGRKRRRRMKQNNSF